MHEAPSTKNDIETAAVEYFRQGYNCAESVFMSLTDALGMKGDFIPRIATGFGGGIGRQGEICGAVSGAILAIGLVFGRMDPSEPRDPSYTRVSELLQAFQAEHGQLLCRELTGCDLLTVEGQKKFTQENMHEEVCARLVATAARLGLKILKG